MTPLDLATTLWPELADLRHLDGWTWRCGEGNGDLGEVGLCGYRQLGVLWMDVLWIYGPADAVAVRSMIDGPATWQAEGDVAAVLSALTQLPRPGQPGAPLTAITVGLPVAAPDADVRPIR
jgi:hypothetical protein